MTSRIVAYKDAVEARFRELLPTAVHLFTHHGEFGEKELKTYLVKAPCVILAPIGMPKAVVAGPNVMAEIGYAAFILTRSRPELERLDAALMITEVILGFLPYEPFGLARKPSDVEAANLYSGAIDGAGMALWAIRWRQTIELAAKDDCRYNELDDFLRLHATYHVDADLDTIPGDDDPDNWDAPQTIELPGPDA